MRYPAKTPLPAPLPPERRTVGQLIAESIKLYMERFWRLLPLGAPAVALTLAERAYGAGEGHLGFPSALHLGLLVAIESPLCAAAYVAAAVVVVGGAPRARIVRAYALAVVVFAVFRVAVTFVVLPGLLWLALVSLAVPALLAEDLAPAQALRRAVALVAVDAK